MLQSNPDAMQQVIVSGAFLLVGALIAAIASFLTAYFAEQFRNRNEHEREIRDTRAKIYLDILHELNEIQIPKDFHNFLEITHFMDFYRSNRDSIEFYASTNVFIEIISLSINLQDLKDIGNKNLAVSAELLTKTTTNISNLKNFMKQEIVNEKRHRLSSLFYKTRQSIRQRLKAIREPKK